MRGIFSSIGMPSSPVLSPRATYEIDTSNQYYFPAFQILNILNSLKTKPSNSDLAHGLELDKVDYLPQSSHFHGTTS